jgi:uncharacterized membrane protein YhaH (DUF805 family)
VSLSASPSDQRAEPPLWLPYYGAPIRAAFARFWKKYATFSGRASRSEFWWWSLIYFVVVNVIDMMFLIISTVSSLGSNDGASSFEPGFWILFAITWIVSLGTLIPNLAVVWRRLHDTNRSGASYFLFLIPFAGVIIVPIFLAGESNPAGARFDRQPGAAK